MKRHQYPLVPCDPPPLAVPGKRWYRCERCGDTFSEAHPTELGSAPECGPQHSDPDK